MIEDFASQHCFHGWSPTGCDKPIKGKKDLAYRIRQSAEPRIAQQLERKERVTLQKIVGWDIDKMDMIYGYRTTGSYKIRINLFMSLLADLADVVIKLDPDVWTHQGWFEKKSKKNTNARIITRQFGHQNTKERGAVYIAQFGTALRNGAKTSVPVTSVVKEYIYCNVIANAFWHEQCDKRKVELTPSPGLNWIEIVFVLGLIMTGGTSNTTDSEGWYQTYNPNLRRVNFGLESAAQYETLLAQARSTDGPIRSLRPEGEAFRTAFFLTGPASLERLQLHQYEKYKKEHEGAFTLPEASDINEAFQSCTRSLHGYHTKEAKRGMPLMHPQELRSNPKLL